MLLIIGFTAACFIYIRCESSDIPAHHTKVLEDILNKEYFMNSTDFDYGSVFEYLFGINGSNPETEMTEAAPDERSDSLTHLDVSVLDMGTMKKIVNVARKKEAEIQAQGRRYWYIKEEAFIKYNKEIDRLVYNLIRQSVYHTRHILLRTKPARKRYKDDLHYNIAILYGSLLEIKTKMQNIFGVISHFPPDKTRFHWYLVTYEKMLARHVDVAFMVEKIFEIHKKWRNSFE